VWPHLKSCEGPEVAVKLCSKIFSLDIVSCAGWKADTYGHQIFLICSLISTGPIEARVTSDKDKDDLIARVLPQELLSVVVASTASSEVEKLETCFSSHPWKRQSAFKLLPEKIN
jgi:hypothetical protein